MPKHWTESELQIALDPNLSPKKAAQLLEFRSEQGVARLRWSRRVKMTPEARSQAIKDAHNRSVKTRAVQPKKPKKPKPVPKPAPKPALKPVPTHAWASVFSADDRLLGIYHPSQHLRIEKYRAKVRHEPQNVSSDVHAVCATPKTAKAGSVGSTRPAL